jgi:hypothetical protein
MHGVPLDRLLDGIDRVLVDRYAVPGSEPLVTGVAILDPDDDPRDHHDELVLVIGVRGREARAVVRAAIRGGAAAVGVKGDPRLADPGVPLLVVRPEVRWDQLALLLGERLDAAELPGPGGPGGSDAGDLYLLAEDLAVATGGIVAIEDVGNRVLAYSRSDDADIDELRRLSILGWQGPEPYLRMLREWGVFDRLRAGEQVVAVEEHPEIGVRPRLAVGIRAGARYLGTIWVQRRATPFAPRAAEALVGAARLAAVEILRRRTGGTPDRGSRLDLVADLLTGRTSTDLVAGRLGLDPGCPALVVGFGLPATPDAPARELHREQVLGLVSVYATAHHRQALVGPVEDRVYAVLPAESPGRPPAQAPVLSWVRHAVEVLRSRAGGAVCAGLGRPAPALDGLPAARAEVDRVLDALSRGAGDRAVATIGELRSEVLLAETVAVLGGRPELNHPGVAALVAHDAGRLVTTVLAHLDALGDVGAAATALNVHPNTVRYRLRRAREISGIDLDDPRERLACHLQLLAAVHRNG